MTQLLNLKYGILLAKKISFHLPISLDFSLFSGSPFDWNLSFKISCIPLSSKILLIDSRGTISVGMSL